MVTPTNLSQVKTRIVQYSKFLSRILSPDRALPNFIIIGTMRGGTSSLFRYLDYHPNIVPPLRKEIHYFDHDYRKGLYWYKLFFPSNNEVNKMNKLTYEATPYYLFHPLVPERVHKMNPNIKLIILLRNPIKRAYSHYKYIYKLGLENLSFEDGIRKESERLEKDKQKMKQNPYYNGYHMRHHSYLSRGIYVKQIKRWFNYFPKECFKIIRSEEFFSETQKTYDDVLNFLGLEEFELEEIRAFNASIHDEIPQNIHDQLKEFFFNYNEELNELIGINFNE